MAERLRPILCTVAALLIGTVSAAGELADCDRRVREHPGDYFAWDCFQQAARQDESVVRRLRARLQVEPEDPSVQLALGVALQRTEQDRAESLLRRAAAGFAGRGSAVGEAQARFILGRFLFRRYRLDEADEQAAQAIDLAQSSGSDALATLARTQRFRIWTMQGRYSEAWLGLKRLEPGIDRYQGRIVSNFYSAIANAAINMNLDEEALAYWDLAAEFHDGAFYKLLASHEQLKTLAKMAAAGRVSDDRVEAKARATLEIAERSGAPSIVTTARCLLAAFAPFSEALDHLESCAVAAEEHDCRRYEFQALLSLAERAAPLEATEARRALERAQTLYDRSIVWDPEGASPAWLRSLLAALRLRVGPRKAAIAEAEAAVRAMERLRAEQRVEVVRASTFTAFAGFYHRYASFLLGDPQGPPSTEAIADALAIVERMRARLLLDRLAVADILPDEDPAHPSVVRRGSVLAEISAAQKRLSEPTLTAARRQDALLELERLELQEAELRAQILAAQPLPAALHARWTSTPADVQRALEPGEMLVSFQIPSAEAPPAWALVVTSGGIDTYRVPPAQELDPMIRVFAGTLRQADVTQDLPGARLFAELLAPAFEQLEDSPRRLVIVAEGPLVRLPFDALRERPEGPMLAGRVETVIVPSVTTWLHWRNGRADEEPRPVLALADPTLPAPAGSASAEERGGLLREASRLGRLPRARVEAREIVRHVGGDSELLVGDEASESVLKRGSLRRFGVVHLAAHALVDEQHPERSAVVLASTGDEDGLLQMREIVDLKIDRGVVVLSARSSAAGAQLEGEGVMSLARAFFAAGAGTVVGSLWPLRDDEAEPLFREFYQRLAGGDTISAAMAGARRSRMRAGASPASWAGVIVLGDGSARPIRGGASISARWILGLALVVVSAAALWWRRLR